MSVLLIDDETILLQESDYPDYFVDKHHPDDYKITKEPIRPEHIYHLKADHNRVMVRLSTQIGPDMFIPITFICAFIFLLK